MYEATQNLRSFRSAGEQGKVEHRSAVDLMSMSIEAQTLTQLNSAYGRSRGQW